MSMMNDDDDDDDDTKEEEDGGGEGGIQTKSNKFEGGIRLLRRLPPL
jgi:hypothetical protein